MRYYLYVAFSHHGLVTVKSFFIIHILAADYLKPIRIMVTDSVGVFIHIKLHIKMNSLRMSKGRIIKFIYHVLAMEEGK